MFSYETDLNRLSNLQDNWDGYGGLKPSKHTIDNACYIFNALKDYGYLPDIIPTSKGNISFEWGDSDIDDYFFVEISEKECIIYYVKDHDKEYLQVSIDTVPQLDDLITNVIRKLQLVLNTKEIK